MTQGWPFSRERLRQLRRNAEGKCSISRCNKRVHRGGKCKGHYQKDLDRLRETYAKKVGKQ